jgi:hypothetical protein
MSDECEEDETVVKNGNKPKSQNKQNKNLRHRDKHKYSKENGSVLNNNKPEQHLTNPTDSESIKVSTSSCICLNSLSSKFIYLITNQEIYMYDLIILKN